MASSLFTLSFYYTLAYNTSMKQVQDHKREPICTIEGCNKKHLARGYCSVHYTRWWTKGSPYAYSKNIPNTYRKLAQYAEIDLRNTPGEIVGIARIDSLDLPRVIQYRWCMDSSGYAIGRVNRKLIRLHSFIMGVSYIDHRNRNRLDNTRENLRAATHYQNMMNKAGIDKTSRYRGVSWSKSNRWAVYAKFKQTQKRFWGYYDTELEAAHAYNKVAKKYGDEFTYLNTFPGEAKA
jgi:hypothetical protein